MKTGLRRAPAILFISFGISIGAHMILTMKPVAANPKAAEQSVTTYYIDPAEATAAGAFFLLGIWFFAAYCRDRRN